MTKEYFGASQVALVASAVTLSGQAGWTQRDWEVAATQKGFWEQMKLVANGQAEVIPLTPAKPPRQPSERQKIISFYAQVFDLGKEATAALKGQKVKGDEDLLQLSASLPILGDDRLSFRVALDKIAIFWPDESAPYTWGNVEGVKIPKGHERPKGAYLLYHAGEANSDKAHKGKSYNDALAIMKFMTPKEYVIFWAYTLWSQQKYLDQTGWTRLCATWPGGSVVRGYSSSRRLYLYCGDPDGRGPGSGPREVSFVPIT